MDLLTLLRRRFPQGGQECGIAGEGGGGNPGCQTTTKADGDGTKSHHTNTAALATATADEASNTVYTEGSTQTGTADANSATATTTSNPSYQTISTTSAISTATSSADTQSSGGGGTSTKTKLAIAIPVAIVGALIIMGIIFFILRRRRRRQQQQLEKEPIPSNPYEENAKNESNAVSTSQLMVTVPANQANNQREPGFPRFPMLDVPNSREGDVSPAESAGHMSQNDTHSEVYGMAVSRDQRPNATEQDHRVISRSASPANALETHVQGQRGEHDDAVSVVSENGTREQHYDDMSSVSSFDGDTPRADDHQHPFR